MFRTVGLLFADIFYQIVLFIQEIDLNLLLKKVLFSVSPDFIIFMFIILNSNSHKHQRHHRI